MKKYRRAANTEDAEYCSKMLSYVMSKIDEITRSTQYIGRHLDSLNSWKRE
ncbi:MAG TPA: hypothetical protein PK778_07270 [Bacillota bacterium]|nr:hypothetical protein [Bacillota bacterium]